MRKTVFAICEQQRRSSACASARSDQQLCCSLPRQYHTSSFYIRNFKPLPSFCGCIGWFEFYLKTGFLVMMLKLKLLMLFRLFFIICLTRRFSFFIFYYKSQLMRLWYLSHRRPAKAQASLRIRAVSPEPSLFAHMTYGRKRRVRPKTDI